MTDAVDQQTHAFERLLTTMRQLRNPQGGCPWDLEQTHASLRNTLLEEAYEALEALDSGDPGRLVEEFGDVLFQVVFHAQIGADDGTFAIGEVIDGLTDKLVSRHPHVFGDATAATAGEVVGQWERLKAAEREAKGEGQLSMLDGVPKTMPALAYAQAVTERAGRAGFDISSGDGALDKLAERLRGITEGPSAEARESELGDILFMAAVDAARMGIDAEAALRGANQRFRERFGHVEALVRTRGTTIAELDPAARAGLWDEAKAAMS